MNWSMVDGQAIKPWSWIFWEMQVGFHMKKGTSNIQGKALNYSLLEVLMLWGGKKSKRWVQEDAKTGMKRKIWYVFCIHPGRLNWGIDMWNGWNAQLKWFAKVSWHCSPFVHSASIHCFQAQDGSANPRQARHFNRRAFWWTSMKLSPQRVGLWEVTRLMTPEAMLARVPELLVALSKYGPLNILGGMFETLFCVDYN